MSIEDLEYKEKVLRHEFMDRLECLNTDGTNDMCTVKTIKMYGILWHLTHQLLKAETEEKMTKKTGSETMAETMNIQATGLKMTGSTK